MLIRLTLAENKDTFYMRARDVRTIQKDPKDRITTIITTDIFTQTGPLAYRVLESSDEVAMRVQVVISGQVAPPVGYLAGISDR